MGKSLVSCFLLTHGVVGLPVLTGLDVYNLVGAPNTGTAMSATPDHAAPTYLYFLLNSTNENVRLTKRILRNNGRFLFTD